MEILIITALFLLCAIFMTIEIFIVPGISLAGIAALVCMIIANYITFSLFGTAVGGWVLIASIIFCSLLGVWAARSKFLEKYWLHKSIDSTAATTEQLSVKVGEEGTSITRLALIGNADINGNVIEVKSADGFIDEGTPIVVVRVEEAQITVKRKS
ncbi:MAG: nodulation protein NfeD [Paraprevotella sp.]|jgi:membrane-bound ClpP family serine protease|nr:nodulation protein NfeD [Paraprevotella sp.]